MIRSFALILMILAPCGAVAETLIAARTIRAKQIIGAGDVTLVAGDIPGTLIDPAEAIGQEARGVIYAGRPVRIDEVGPPAIIERNQIVPLIYRNIALTLKTDARALARAGVGDTIRVMNLSSRATVTGIVAADGTVQVGALTGPVN